MTGYSSVFGGTLIQPANFSFQSLTLTTNITTSWPMETNSATLIAATNEVSAASGGLSITMPSALLGSPGTGVVFNNIGANIFTVKDASGNTILTSAVGSIWMIYLRTNLTAGGTWGILQLGAGTSSAQASSLAGAGLTVVGGQLAESMPYSTFNTNYTTGINDRAVTLMWTGGAGTLTLPTPSTLTSNWFIAVKNSGSGTLTIAPTSGTIDGSASLAFSPNDSASIFTDGSNFYTFGHGQNPVFAFSNVSISVAGGGSDFTLSAGQQNQISYKFTGILTSNRNIIVPNTVQQYWVNNQTTGGSFTLTIKTAAGTGITMAQGAAAILMCDSVNVSNASTGGIALPVTVSQGGTGATTAGSALTNLGGTSTGVAVFTAANTAAAAAAIGAVTLSNATDQALMLEFTLS